MWLVEQAQHGWLHGMTWHFGDGILFVPFEAVQCVYYLGIRTEARADPHNVGESTVATWQMDVDADVHCILQVRGEGAVDAIMAVSCLCLAPPPAAYPPVRPSLLCQCLYHHPNGGGLWLRLSAFCPRLSTSPCPRAVARFSPESPSNPSRYSPLIEHHGAFTTPPFGQTWLTLEANPTYPPSRAMIPNPQPTTSSSSVFRPGDR